MGLLGRRTVIAKCPACQATTKVSVPPNKPTIRCPRCQAAVPLAFARNYTEAKPVAEPEHSSLKHDVTAFDYASEVPIERQSQKALTKKQRQKRYSSETNTDISYPDHSRNLIRYATIATVLICVFSILGVGYLFWRETVNSRNQEYLSSMKESVEQHQTALKNLKKVLDPLEGLDAQKNFREAKGKIDFLANRRKHLAVPDERTEGFKELQADLTKAEKELATTEEEIKRLSTQTNATPEKKKSESVAANLGWSMTKGPPPSPSQVNSNLKKAADDNSVIINLPGITKEEWNDDFSRRFSLLADNGEGKVTVYWAGDLLTLEVRPVIDPARYATKINFGRLLYYSRNDRIISLEFNPSKVNNYKAQGDIITPILLDLKQHDKPPKLHAALSKLNGMKVDTGRQAEVAAVLETIAINGALDAAIRSMAIKLIPNWSGKESAELLIRLMDDKASSVRITATDALVETRAPSAASALVKKWDKLDAGQISAALISLGTDAETSVLPFLNNTESITLRIEACRVLQQIGTTESLKPLLDLMNTKNQSPLIVEAARNAMKQILERTSK